MSDTFVLKTSDVSNTLYDMNRNYQGQQTWRQAFLDNELAEQKALSDLQYDYSKALNEAYASSLSNKNAILDSSLGTGYKQQMVQQNAMDLQDAFEQYRQNYLNNASTVSQQYGEIESGLSETLQSQSKMMADIVNMLPDYYNKIYENSPETFSTVNWSRYTDEEGNPISFDTIMAPGIEENGALTIENEDGSISLTDAGREFYKMLFFDNENNKYSFQQYLTDSGKTDYVDFLNSMSADYGTLNKDVLWKDVLGFENYENYKPQNYVPESSVNTALDAMEEGQTTSKSFSITDDDIVDRRWLSGESGNEQDIVNRLKTGQWQIDTSESWTADTFVNIDKGWFDDQAVVRDFVEAVKNNQVKDGTIIDIDPGAGTNFFVYKNNQIYRLKDSGEVAGSHNELLDGIFDDMHPEEGKKYASNLGKNVDIYAESFSQLDFGSYFGSGDVNGEQYNYIDKIIDDAKHNKIEPGQVIIANAGRRSGGYASAGIFAYLGDGKFIQLESYDSLPQSVIDKRLYLPDGWYITANGVIRGEKWRPKQSNDITVNTSTKKGKTIDIDKAKQYASEIADTLKN